MKGFYGGGRFGHDLMGSVAKVVLVVVIMSLFFGMPFVAFLAEVIDVVGAWLIEIAQRVAE